MGKVLDSVLSGSKENQREAEDRSALFLVADSDSLSHPPPTSFQQLTHTQSQILTIWGTQDYFLSLIHFRSSEFLSLTRGKIENFCNRTKIFPADLICMLVQFGRRTLMVFVKDAIADSLAYLSLQRHDAESSGTTPCTRIEHVSAPVSCKKTSSSIAVSDYKNRKKEELEMLCFIWNQDQKVKDFYFLFVLCSSEF
jgi:hypothetical protein